jgi:hypothetical protein
MSAPLPLIAQIHITYPSPSWDYTPITPRVGDVVIFDASEFEKRWNEGGESVLVSLDWHFGDGSSASGAIVEHKYTEPGSFLAGVTATDDRGYGGTSEMEIVVSPQTPVTVYLSLNSGLIYTGQEVELTGNLTCNGQGVPNELVILSRKTYIEGESWVNIATVKTNEYGSYTASWKAFFGYYEVKATWKGNMTYPESSISRNVIVQGFGNLITEFSSNSTITELNFNQTTNILAFSVEGPSGTSGYVNINLEKQSEFNPEKIAAFMDGKPLNFDMESSDQFWTLKFSYNHSTHSIIVQFNSEVQPFPFWIVLLTIVVLFALLAFFKKRRLLLDLQKR